MGEVHDRFRVYNALQNNSGARRLGIWSWLRGQCQDSRSFNVSLRRQRQCLRQWQRLCPVHMWQASGRGSLGAAQAALMGMG